MNHKQLMKITCANYGMGGYQDAMFGASFIFEGHSRGFGDFWGFWDMKPSDNAKWNETDQIRNHGEVTMRISAIMKDAKVTKFHHLIGIPVEVIIENNTLKSWRVLTEVL